MELCDLLKYIQMQIHTAQWPTWTGRGPGSSGCSHAEDSGEFEMYHTAAFSQHLTLVGSHTLLKFSWGVVFHCILMLLQICMAFYCLFCGTQKTNIWRISRTFFLMQKKIKGLELSSFKMLKKYIYIHVIYPLYCKPSIIVWGKDWNVNHHSLKFLTLLLFGGYILSEILS